MGHIGIRVSVYSSNRLAGTEACTKTDGLYEILTLPANWQWKRSTLLIQTRVDFLIEKSDADGRCSGDPYMCVG